MAGVERKLREAFSRLVQSLAMVLAFAIVLVLVGFGPLLAIFDGAVLPSGVSILVAVGLVAVAVSMERADRPRLNDLALPVALGAALLAAYLLVQMLPLPVSDLPLLSWISDLAHPVWKSAADAFQKPVAGRITVDIGATAVALVEVLGFAGVVVLTMAVAFDRDRAEVVLVALTVVTGVIAVVVSAVDLLGISGFSGGRVALDAACLGLVVSAACGTLVAERSKSRRRKNGQARFGTIGIVAILGFLASLLAIVLAHSASILFAAAGGLATFAAVVMVRRLDIGRFGAVAIGVTAVVIGVTVIVRSVGADMDPRLAFVEADATSLDLTRRILADVPPLGTGAGTFTSLIPVYRPSDAASSALEAATAAAKVSTELGSPVLVLLVVVAVAMALWLLWGALRRGRDYFYPAAGAAGLVSLSLLGFVNVGIFGPTIALLAAPLLGLAIAQAKGSGGTAI